MKEIKEKLKYYIKKNIYVCILAYIINNLWQQIKILCGNINTTSGTTHNDLSIEQSVDYIQKVFADYQRVSKQHTFTGHLAELGPGDNLGVILMFLANGISTADAPDRFYSNRNIMQQQKIYQKLSALHPKINNILSANQDNSYENINNVTRYYGKNAAGEFFFNSTKKYDIIISRSVLEHLDNPLLALQKMYLALNPGGMLIHKVDLRDHGMLTPWHHATKFLEIPNWLYKLMTKGIGYPNRILFHRYKQLVKNFNETCKHYFYIAGLHGVQPLNQEYCITKLPHNYKQLALNYISQYKHKYAAEFKNIPNEELMISSFFWVCKKPGNQPS
jgi:SAM-dependent methyltransferase